MPTTYVNIASTTLANSTTQTVTFSSISQTYTDLAIRLSLRGTSSNNRILRVRINGNINSVYSITRLDANSTSTGSDRQTSTDGLRPSYTVQSPSATANTFSNVELYLPSYTSTTQNKIMSAVGVAPDSAGTWLALSVDAGLYQSTSAITSITLEQSTSEFWASGSSFYLYGIKNS